ncbi:uncharacterized protein BKCO1_3900098 [Diplodia corticola]|uniref:Uncharacterized protein n=1 Tax=Diplodia corticola TaxID=236234 RepID=A0A1J9QV66_9PEZI|nr:uncharacterized protein BKCO1_3900098 [Diplodia corticola]OJD32320.1 hypothetical protein BKCO1_3900098 [Diplodia corticola]
MPYEGSKNSVLPQEDRSQSPQTTHDEDTSLCLISGPTDPKAPAPEFYAFLEQFEGYPGGPFVYGRPVAFHTGTDRVNWTPYLLDANEMSTFAEFWKGKKHGKRTWLGLFTTIVESTVAANWWDQVWHCWGVAVITGSKGRGKHLLIYDCDPVPDAASKRRRDVLLGYQQRLVAFAEAQATLLGVWYNTDDSGTGQNRCVTHTCEWIKRMVMSGDRPLEDDDERIQNYIRLDRR